MAHDGWGTSPGNGADGAAQQPQTAGSGWPQQPGPAPQQPAQPAWPAGSWGVGSAPGAPEHAFPQPTFPQPAATPPAQAGWPGSSAETTWSTEAAPAWPAGPSTAATPVQPPPAPTAPVAPWAAVPPQPAPAPQREVSPPSTGKGGAGRRVLAAVVALCLVAAAAAVTWYVQRDDAAAPTETAQPTSGFGAPLPTTADDDDAAEDDAATDDEGSASVAPSSSVPTTSPAPTPTVSPEEAALTQLQTLRASSLGRLVLDDRWVAQVASKSVGITDPLQTAQNGTHTFYAVDILAESRAAVVSVADPSAVLVLQSVDFGKRSYAADGQPYWVTVVDLGFTSSDQVKAWCASTYASLTPEQLANACAARTLAPPHD